MFIQEEKLRGYLLAGDDSPVKFNFLSFDPIPLPLDPDIQIRGINAEKVKIFKVIHFLALSLKDKQYIFQSATAPFLLYFQTTTGDEYPVIFKNGDDLRQDQLILQMFMLMNRVGVQNKKMIILFNLYLDPTKRKF